MSANRGSLIYSKAQRQKDSPDIVLDTAVDVTKNGHFQTDNSQCYLYENNLNLSIG